MGTSRNGALNAEAVVFFDTALAEGLGPMRKRSGHFYSKMRSPGALVQPSRSAAIRSRRRVMRWARLAAAPGRLQGQTAMQIPQPWVSLK